MIVLTGAAGFIGFHVAKMLLSQGHHIIGIDNMNDYYDVSLKKGRLAQLAQNDQFHFYQADISDAAAITDIFKRHAGWRALTPTEQYCASWSGRRQAKFSLDWISRADRNSW